ncbi:efflux transporter outer membrane subunit [Noviherbaspirillum humi]|nr:efflux transporter outer membrane subunit [Noviherbaspirillum humi]
MRVRLDWRRPAALALASAALAGCAAGPDYRKPDVSMPAAWKTEAPWKPADPSDAAPKGEWWSRFGDPQLDALQRKALADSPTLAVASARLAQARSALAAASASLLPQVTLNSRDARQRIAANRPLNNYNAPNFSTVQNDFVLSAGASYELDLFGRVQRAVEGAQASAEQVQADFENVRLLLGADLAAAYVNLRTADAEIDIVSRSLALQRRVLDLATSRHDLGATSGLDMAQQQALVDATLTQLELLGRQRAQFENAIATLTGTPAPSFSLPAAAGALRPPEVPIGIPSDILERRPDVAAAERAMAVANAQIGLASAAYYPSVILSANYGDESRVLSQLFSTPSLIWSVGATLTQTLFDGGRIRANVSSARAAHEAAAATYRRVVLSAMQEAQDGITGMAKLEKAHAQALKAAESASRVLDLALTRYEGGVATALDVITAQQSLLNAERQAAQVLGQRLLASVGTIRALGGGW